MNEDGPETERHAGRPSGRDASEAAAETIGAIAARVRDLSLENEKLFRDLIATERRFRSLSRSVWRVQEEERRRLARELHDGIGQTLTALKNQLETIRLQEGWSREQTSARIDESLAMTAQALHETRELSRLLRPAVLDDLGLVPALRWLARTVGERFSVEVELQLSGLDQRLDYEVETLAFRIVQEALTNVAKHSGADAARVEVAQSASSLKIRVSDPGRGFDPRQASGVEPTGAGMGLRGMRDRAELFGGSARIDSSVGGGTRIEVVVPLTPSEDGA